MNPWVPRSLELNAHSAMAITPLKSAPPDALPKVLSGGGAMLLRTFGRVLRVTAGFAAGYVVTSGLYEHDWLFEITHN